MKISLFGDPIDQMKKPYQWLFCGGWCCFLIIGFALNGFHSHLKERSAFFMAALGCLWALMFYCGIWLSRKFRKIVLVPDAKIDKLGVVFGWAIVTLVIMLICFTLFALGIW